MKTSDFLSILDNPNLISGIYNYCDRWCERCPMTARCSVFLTTTPLNPEDFTTEEAYFEAAMDDVKNSFTISMELLQQMADEKGIDLDEDEDETADETADSDDLPGIRSIEREDHTKSPLAIHSMEYLQLARAWLDTCSASLKDLEKNLQDTALMDLPDRNPSQEAAALRDALEVIPYYMSQIYVKLMRAQSNRRVDDAWFEENNYPKDSDGSAKVALIGIDNSIRAWEVMLQYLPSQEGDILTILSLLENLRRQVEITFPDARSFKRPGFDD